MTDASLLLWLFALGTAALASIPYLIWVVVTAVKRRWRKLLYLVAIPLVGYGLLVLVTGLIDRIAYRNYLRNVYDTRVTFQRPIFEYDSDRSFHGDGYSITIYELPDSIRERFEKARVHSLKGFPKRPHYREDWETEAWREAPFDAEFSRYLSFALGPYRAGNADGLSEHFHNIQTALKSEQTYYSFFKYDHGDHPGNIDMFIVDLVQGRVYQINHNT